jgi:hypothetical protein
MLHLTALVTLVLGDFEATPVGLDTGMKCLDVGV